MKVLVTGSSGFIGSTLTAKLVEKGFKVKCLVRRSSNLRWLQNLPVELTYGDFDDVSSLRAAVADVEIVFHLAGITKAQNRMGYIKGNLLSTRNLLAACEKYGPASSKFVFVSSLAAAGPSPIDRPLNEMDPPRPISHYGQSKYLAEQEVLNYAQKKAATIIRPPVVYGPRDRDVFVYFKSVQKGVMFLLGRGSQRVSLVHVDDLVHGILLAAEATMTSGKIYYICGDGAYDWRTIGQTIAKAVMKKPVIVPVPIWLLAIVAAFSTSTAKIIGKPALLNWDKVAEMKQAAWLCSNERAKIELGFKPTVDLDSGMRMTAAWYQSIGWL